MQNKGGVWKYIKPCSQVDWNETFKDSPYNNEAAMAEAFAKFFKDKVNTLKCSPDATKIFQDLKEIYKDAPSWDLSSCTTESVAKAIDGLTPSLSAGPDGIPNRLIKSLKFEALDAITCVFNKCISEGVFPNVWKCSKVRPIHKKGAKNKIENYRPVCLYSTLGKLLEAVVRDQFAPHLDKILPSNMFGFRSGRGTQDAVLYALDKIRQYRSEGKRVAALSMDCSSAFDLISHEVILRSLEVVGIGPQMQRWTKSYLSNCSNFVQIGDGTSEVWVLDTGSGQGRRLSPDYFNLATLSRALLCLLADSAGYADDGLDVVYGSTPEECDSKLKLVIQERVEWHQKIGLALNSAKTEFIGFGYTPAPMNIDGINLLPKSEINFLGVTIQSNLNWTTQTSTLCNKIRSAAGRIRSEARLLSVSDRRCLYTGWIQGLLFFNGLAVLPTMTQSEIGEVQRACNAGIRAIVGLPKYGFASITNLRKKLNLPSAEQIGEYCVQVAAWKKFSKTPPSHDSGPQTRAMKNGNIPHPDQRGHRAYLSNTLLIKAWNKIPIEVKALEHLTTAKRCMKKYLFH